MRQVRSSGTMPESRFQEALLHESPGSALRSFAQSGPHLTGKPDFWFPDLKLAVFIDGDFWHGRQWLLRGFLSLEHHLTPRSNPNYWIHKIRRNMARDRKVTQSLLIKQINVLRFWESDLKQNQEACLALLKKAAIAIQKFPHRRRLTDSIRRKALFVEGIQDQDVGKSLDTQRSTQTSKTIAIEKISLSFNTEEEEFSVFLNRSKSNPFRLVLLHSTEADRPNLNLIMDVTSTQNRAHRWDWFEIQPSLFLGIGIHQRFFHPASCWSIPSNKLPGIPLEEAFDSESSAKHERTPSCLGRNGRRDLLKAILIELEYNPQAKDKILIQWAWDTYIEPVLSENLRNQVWWRYSSTNICDGASVEE